MGALHAGHLALVDAARRADCASIVASIFVNPLQFGPNEDFARYPRTFEADCAELDGRGVAVVYAPPVEVMYPQGFAAQVDVGPISTVFEGARRPGHFNGVATVMTKLLNVIDPDVFVMGQKDAQQVAVLAGLRRDFDIPATMLVVPTVREADGLALSSRNVYLDADQRAAAPSLFQALSAVVRAVRGGERDPDRALTAGRPLLRAPLVEDYLAIVDPTSFAPVARADEESLVIGAVYAGSTRLIDNVRVAEGRT